MTFKPLNGQAFIIEEVKTEGKHGIILPNEKKVGSMGTIFAIEDNECGLKKGDRVIFSKFVFEDIHVPDEKGEPIPHMKYGPYVEIPAKLV